MLSGLGKLEEAEQQYREALTMQANLAAEFPSEAGFRNDLAMIHSNLGILLSELGKRAEAEEQHRQALELRENLTAQFPAVPDYRYNLARSNSMMGNLLWKSRTQGKQEEAAELYRHALSIEEKLTTDFPIDPRYRFALANSQSKMGLMMWDQGKRVEAEEHHRKAVAIEEQLAREFPVVLRYRVWLGGYYCNHGKLISEGGNPSGSLEWYTKAIDTLTPIHEKDPLNPTAKQFLRNSHSNRGLVFTQLKKYEEAFLDIERAVELSPQEEQNHYRVDLGGAYCNLGILAIGGGNASGSLEWYTKAIDTLTPIHKKDPLNSWARQYLSNSHLNRGSAYTELKKYEEAFLDMERAVELSPTDQQPIPRIERARLHAVVGQAAKAVAEIDELTKGLNLDGNQFYKCACVCAIASRSATEKSLSYAERAMEMLQKAVESGFTDATAMIQDRDLEPIRDRDDVKKLIVELEEKPKKM